MIGGRQILLPYLFVFLAVAFPALAVAQQQAAEASPEYSFADYYRDIEAALRSGSLTISSPHYAAGATGHISVSYNFSFDRAAAVLRERGLAAHQAPIEALFCGAVAEAQFRSPAQVEQGLRVSSISSSVRAGIPAEVRCEMYLELPSQE